MEFLVTGGVVGVLRLSLVLLTLFRGGVISVGISFLVINLDGVEASLG